MSYTYADRFKSEHRAEDVLSVIDDRFDLYDCGGSGQGYGWYWLGVLVCDKCMRTELLQRAEQLLRNADCDDWEMIDVDEFMDALLDGDIPSACHSDGLDRDGFDIKWEQEHGNRYIETSETCNDCGDTLHIEVVCCVHDDCGLYWDKLHDGQYALVPSCEVGPEFVHEYEVYDFMNKYQADIDYDTAELMLGLNKVRL